MNKIVLLAAFCAMACVSTPKAPLFAGYCSSTRADIERLVPAKSLRESCALSRYTKGDLAYELCLEWTDNCDPSFEFE